MTEVNNSEIYYLHEYCSYRGSENVKIERDVRLYKAMFPEDMAVVGSFQGLQVLLPWFLVDFRFPAAYLNSAGLRIIAAFVLGLG